LLREAGEHTVAEPDDAESLAAALRSYLTRWTADPVSYQPRAEFDLDAYEYGNLGRRLLQLVSTGSTVGDEGTPR
jgi:hypothetical protein